MQAFERHLLQNILALHSDLQSETYTHGGYHAFKINDPKPRDIHKATVRDRLLHHALYRQLYPFFDRTFIVDSYSCRIGKGTHKAMNRFRTFAYKVSKNNTRTCWVLKCDIRKFFASIDHAVLKNILAVYIPDQRIRTLLSGIIDSICPTPGVGQKGLPLGNLTSQLLVNIYMNECDQWVKHYLKAKHYIRYADDFVFLSHDKTELVKTLSYMIRFLRKRLWLEMHPKKVSIGTLAAGVAFLGWVHFPGHRVLRTVTKKRMFRRVRETEGNREVVQSYLGLLSHGDSHNLRTRIKNLRGIP